MRTVKLASICCALVVATVSAQRQGPVLFEGVRLIIGDGSAPIERGAFVVQNGEITAIGRMGEVKPPSSVTRVDRARRSCPR